MVNLIKPWLINFSIGQSAVRNQGVGIANGIRYNLRDLFDYNTFFSVLKDRHGSAPYYEYLNYLTTSLDGLMGRDRHNNETGDRISWGAARKCINLLARSAVYNIYLSQHYDIDITNAQPGNCLTRLELPLDSFSVAGIRRDLHLLNPPDLIIPKDLIFRDFTIKRLDDERSEKLQRLAKRIAESNIHPQAQGYRVNLDVNYWRSQYPKKVISPLPAQMP